MLPLTFPALDPIAISIGPIAIRWYALAYLAGFILGWRYCLYLARQNPKGPKPVLFDEFLTWAVIGTVIGGRLGYILFYQAEYYFDHPLEMLQVWRGGMSFHGGMLGVIGAAWIFAQKHKINFFAFTDILACVTPIGLFLGRIANFVNGELYGRPTDVPWGIVFPNGGDMPRHPSQLYEAGLEGIVLFLFLFALSRVPKLRGRAGFLSGCFLFAYGVLRFAMEHLREPDAQLGLIAGGITMGQLLCLPMIMFGFYLILWTEKRTKPRAK
ncbi:MAG: prolipoprotein diacylglyceryl transferase [Alphaproteobacteria bacterium]